MSPAEMGGVPVDPGPGDPETATFAVAEAIGDHPVAAEDLAALAAARVSPPVAAALRAVVDWLVGEGPARPLRARADDAALEVVFARVDGAALHAAGDVLAAVGGCVSRVESTRPQAPWVVRVPVCSEREHFLMLMEGGLPVAIPWPAVLHICMARAEELESGLSAPRLAPVGPGPGSAAEVPVVLLGHGLKRGYYVAERLVWRLAARPMETETPAPAPGLTRAVQTEEGEAYWVLDPAWLFRDVEPPALDLPPAYEPAPPAAPEPEPPVRPLTLSEEDVEPLEILEDDFVELIEIATGEESAAMAAEPEIAPPEAAPAAEAPAVPAAPAVRAALVAEDSLTASIFLSRLLEQQGFLVRAVASAAELKLEIERAPWTLVFADTELPDGRGRDHLRAVREDLERVQAGRAPGAAGLVALVRDAEDTAEALAAGVTSVLRKPFDREALIQLLRRLAPQDGAAA